jgi:uncharacterized protein (DUF1697 family)
MAGNHWLSHARERVMPVYVALLRGVNVGQNLLRMERLRELCVATGLKNARTYVQSGNIVFEGARTAEHWCQALERRLVHETRLPVTVIVRTAAEIGEVLAANPFLKEKGIDTTKLHITFLAQAPQNSAVEALRKRKAEPDRFAWIEKEVYLHCPEGYGQTKLSNTAIEKTLAVRATTRNWNTVNKLYEMCAG